MDFKELIKFIEATIAKFQSGIPKIQAAVFRDVLKKIKELDLVGGDVRISAANLKKLTELQGQLQKVILSPEYMESVAEFVKAFDMVTKLQNAYFKSISNDFTIPKLAREIRKIAKESVVDMLTEGMNANVIDPVKDVIRRAITNGSSYAKLQEQLTGVFLENDGSMVRYTKQISTDAINQYSRRYSKLVSADLGLEWFRYSGSNIKTSRPFCLACTDRKYFHVSEIPKLLKGDFPEFKEKHGKIYEKTGLPMGMYPDTTPANFAELLGGYNCGHQYRPVLESGVPPGIVAMVKQTPEYRFWAGKILRL